MRLGAIFCVGVILGAGGWLLFHNLSAAPLALYDEGTYAQVVHESFERRDFLTFTSNHQLFFEKPPLYFWLAGVVTTVTRNEKMGIRLPAAVAGFGVLFLTMLLAFLFTRDPVASVVAGLYLLCFGLFLQGAREARLDMLVSFFILLALYAWWQRAYILFGVFVGLAVLSKSVIAVFAVVPVVVYSVYQRDISWLYEKKFWYGALLGLVIIAPWHIYEWIRFGGVFWRDYIGVHVIGRYQTNLFGSPALQTDYWARLMDYARVSAGLFILSLFSLPLVWQFLDQTKKTAVLYALATIAAMTLVFFTAQTRALSYLLPLYPLAALMVGMAVSFLVQYVYARLVYDPLNHHR